MGKKKGNISDNKVIKRKNVDDVSCWNCFGSENPEHIEPISLGKVRKEHREKLKLYSFLASELSRPKAISLKQKVSEPYSISKKIDEKLAQEAKIPKLVFQDDEPEIVQITQVLYPLKNTEDETVYKVQIETPSKVQRELKFNTQTIIGPRRNSFEYSEESRRIENKSKDERAINVSVQEVQETKPNYIEIVEPTDRIESSRIESPREKREVKINRQISLDSGPHSLEIIEESDEVLRSSKLQSDGRLFGKITPDSGLNSLEINHESDKVDNTSSNGSESGYAGSMNRDSVEICATNKSTPELESSPSNLSFDSCHSQTNTSNLSQSKDFDCSLPMLNTEEKPMRTSTTSLYEEKSNSLKRNIAKPLRWSTLSMCKKPYDVDGR